MLSGRAMGPFRWRWRPVSSLAKVLGAKMLPALVATVSWWLGPLFRERDQRGQRWRQVCAALPLLSMFYWHSQTPTMTCRTVRRDRWRRQSL
jgi:hypothetical protein